MKQLLIEIDDDLAMALERVAPARTRRRSAFIRAAIRQALIALGEEATRGAYQRQPDEDAVHFDPATWATAAAIAPPGTARSPRTRRRR